MADISKMPAFRCDPVLAFRIVIICRLIVIFTLSFSSNYNEEFNSKIGADCIFKLKFRVS